MRLLPFIFLPLLAACVNDGTAFDISGDRQHSISVLREQPFFWKNTVRFALILSRLPHCTRRHNLGEGNPQSVVDVFEVPSGAFILNLGNNYFAAETQTCEGFAPITELNAQNEPIGGLGTYRGRFLTRNGVWVFEKAEAKE